MPFQICTPHTSPTFWNNTHSLLLRCIFHDNLHKSANKEKTLNLTMHHGSYEFSNIEESEMKNNNNQTDGKAESVNSLQH